MAYTGEIRMIKWGLIPNLPSFQVSVGSLVMGSKLVVTKIVREHIEGGRSEYHVECETVEKNDKIPPKKFIWKTFYKEPEEVQYFLPDDKHDYIVL